MKIHYKTILSVMLFITACSAIAETPPQGLYFGLTPPGLTPQVFAPGIISLPGRFEHSICLSKDGGECYFSVRDPSWSYIQIWMTRYESGAWTTQAVAPFSNTWSMSPDFADNDQSLYFNRNNDIYKVVRTPTGWSSPVLMAAPVSSPQDDYSCHISTLGNMWTCSWRAGGAGQCDIWRLQCADGNFINPTNLSTINTVNSECFPVPGPNESYFVFNSNRPGGYGQMDLYICYSDKHGGWTAPRNLGPTINTSAREICAYISPDHKYLFFSRDSGTEQDIYWVDIRALFPKYDFTQDGKVDFDDLRVLARYWLTNEPSVDIAPVGAPDGIVNFLDFAEFAKYWSQVSYW
jgi:hypothetical protein